MQRRRLALMAALAALAGCTSQPGPAAPADYVPHGRFAAAPRDQALRECRLQVESAGRQSFPATGPHALRQIPPPPAAPLPAHASMQACMDAKGYRRAGSSP